MKEVTLLVCAIVTVLAFLMTIHEEIIIRRRRRR